jgi:hypothetical protein
MPTPPNPAYFGARTARPPRIRDPVRDTERAAGWMMVEGGHIVCLTDAGRRLSAGR